MQQPVFNATVNGQTVLEGVSASHLDIVSIGDNSYHILFDQKSYQAKLHKVDYTAKIFHFIINGGHYEVKLSDQFDQVANRLGLLNQHAVKIKEIKAPMPGLVLEVQVIPGQSVSKGEPLVILEAMKMENILRAPGDAVVQKILIEKGKAVDKNQLLIVME
jgi:biotin carboxyl carrier protein